MTTGPSTWSSCSACPGNSLPPVLPSTQVAGPLLPGPAADLGLPPGVPVTVGAANTAAALHAVGLREGQAMLTLGSGGQWAVRETSPDLRPAETTNLFRAVDDAYYRLAPVQNVGVTLNWVRNLFGATWDELYDTAARRAAGRRPSSTPA